MSPTTRGKTALIALVAATGVVLATIGGAPAAQGASDLAPAPTAATSGAGTPETGQVSAGQQVSANTFSKAPEANAAQRSYLKDNGPRSSTLGQVGTASTPPTGPGTTSPDKAPNASTDFQMYRNQRIPAGGQLSPVNEPSSTQSGSKIFAVGNWFAAFSKNRGTNWTFLNPFTIFGSGFCCDQLTAYDVSHNRQFWLAQYNDRLVLANSGGNDLNNWCSYTLTPAMFGLPAGASFDFNKMSLTTNFVYIATNVYGASGGSLVTRWPIDEMTKCLGLGFQYYYRTTEFSPAFIQNAGDTMYWGTNWGNFALGSNFRILRWSDKDGSATVYDRPIAAFTFMTNNTGQCGSANGVVLNWCQRMDSRMSSSGYLAPPSKGTGDAILGWAFNARQDASHPFPYIRRVYFRASDLAYLGSSELFATWGAHLYPSMAPDYRGHVGMAFAWGGGTGTSAYYPGSGVLIDDEISPSQPWAYSFYQFGAGNPCLNSADGLRRWGDYLDIHPVYPGGYGWQATGFAMNANAGSCNATANVSVANVAFGRTRDAAAYSRWK